MNTEYGEIIIYETRDGQTFLEVQLEQETVWLTKNQLAELFGSERSVITKHINNIFNSRELKKDSVSEKFAHTAPDGNTYQTNFYNLDVIIAVGYRVNAKRGTQFRIWATSVLKDHIIKGYTVNERRLAEKGLSEMEQAVALLAKTLETHETISNEGRGVLEVVSRYAKSWSLILKYNENWLELPPDRHTTEKSLDYDKAKAAIKTLKSELAGHGEASNLFGQEQGRQLQGILGNITQTFNGHELYPNTEEKAAHLLYFVIKDHPFTDGNKRIGAFLFLIFLKDNNLLEQSGINDNGLVALALLIAESAPKQKNLMIKLILNLLTLNRY